MNDSVLVKLDQLFDKLKTASDGDDWNTVRGLVAQVASLVKVYIHAPTNSIPRSKSRRRIGRTWLWDSCRTP